MLRNTLTSALVLAAASSAPLLAQTITPLVMEGDVLAGGDTVSRVMMVDVNDSLSWTAVVDVDPHPTQTIAVVLRDGIELARTGDSAMGYPPATLHSVRSTPSLGNAGLDTAACYLSNVGITPRPAVLDNGWVVFVQGSSCHAPGSPPGASYTDFPATWTGVGDLMLVRADVTSPSTGAYDALVRVISDPSMGLLGEEYAVRTGDLLPGQTQVVDMLSANECGSALNSKGQVAFVADLAGPGATDGVVYRDDVLIAQEGSSAGVPGATWDDLSNARIGMNERGQVAVVGVLQGGDEAVAFEGRLIAREGDPVPTQPAFDFHEFGSTSPIEVGESGDVAYVARLIDGGNFLTRAVLCNDQILARNLGTPVAGSMIGNIDAGQHALRMSDDGRYVVFLAELQNGLEGAFLVNRDDRPYEFCTGDNMGDVLTPAAPCPCGNDSVLGAREGCVNSQGHGAFLAAHGSLNAATGDTAMSLYQARPNQPAMLVQGETWQKLPFKDGLICVGNPTERIEVLFTDAAGHATTTSDIAAEGSITAPAIATYQFWYRDPALSVCGEGSNWSHAVAVPWN